MKRLISIALAGLLPALLLSACGSGGGGSTTALPATRAVSTMFLFGNMSSGSTITSVQSTITLPSTILVNYSSPPGTTSGNWPLRSGAVVASGPTRFSVAGGSFDIASRKLEITLVNGGFLNLSSSTTKNGGRGTEIATVNFTLASPGVTTALPAQDASPVVGKQSPGPNIGYQNGCKTNFSTVYR